MFRVSLISLAQISPQSLNFVNRDFTVRRTFQASNPRESRGFGVLHSFANRYDQIYVMFHLVILLALPQVFLPFFRHHEEPYCIRYQSGRDSSVSIATRYGLDGPGIESRWGRDFPHPSTPALGPTQPPVQWVPGLSRG